MYEEVKMTNEFNEKFRKKLNELDIEKMTFKDPKQLRKNLVDKGFLDTSVDQKKIRISDNFNNKDMDIDILNDDEFLYLYGVMKEVSRGKTWLNQTA